MRVLLVATVVAISWGCQSTPIDYGVIRDKASDGTQVSIAELSGAFLSLPDLSERMERLAELEQQALELVADEPLKLGSIGTAILDTYYGSLTGHYALEKFYRHLESPAADGHAQWAQSIREYMQQMGDGSRARPIPAISPVEAKIYALSLGMSPVGSMYQTNEEQPHTMLLQAREGPATIKALHFNLESVYRAMSQRFKNATDFHPVALMYHLARQGDSAAQTAIGGYLASQNELDTAVDWLQAASRSGNLLANSFLARIFWEKASKASDPNLKQEYLDSVLENYLHAIALGSSDAMYALGVLYLNSHYGEDNIASGIPLLNQAADANHSDAAMFLAHMHYTGEAVEKDLDRAAFFYVRASELENPFARRAYARFVLTENRNDARAVGWLKELARDDDSEAMVLLGNLHARGVGVKQNLRRAVGWFKDAVAVSRSDANIVNEVAWTLTVSDLNGLKRQRYALNIMDALMQDSADARSKPEYLDTWAAACAANGDFNRAVEIQQQAVTAAEADQYAAVRDVLKEHLQAFHNRETITEKAP
jgi:TPR repeat protein